MGVRPSGCADGWLPVRVADDGSGTVDWAYLRGVSFDEPFFDQTVERAFRNPFRLLVRRSSTLGEVEAFAGARARDPDGLILHVSRCGSTLLASAIGAIDGVRVLSEPGPVHTVLTTASDPGTAAVLLRRLLRAMAPDDATTAHVVKLDAWTTLDAAVVREAFPHVPWVLVHRDPVEVLVSHQAQRGFHVIPGAIAPDSLGSTKEAVAGMALGEYAATVVGRIMARGAEAVAAAGDRALVVEHPELPDPALDRVASHFGLRLTKADVDRMHEMSEVHAKNPTQPWVDDTAAKRRLATAELRRLADREARGAYEELRRLGKVSHGPA